MNTIIRSVVVRLKPAQHAKDISINAISDREEIIRLAKLLNQVDQQLVIRDYSCPDNSKGISST